MVQALLDIVYAPVWWYSSGAKQVFLGCGASIKHTAAQLAPGLWLKNIFVPMFGQHDLQGRFVSFFVRLGNIIVRGIALVIWMLLVFTFFAFWLVLPLFVLRMFLFALL